MKSIFSVLLLSLVLVVAPTVAMDTGQDATSSEITYVIGNEVKSSVLIAAVATDLVTTPVTGSEVFIYAALKSDDEAIQPNLDLPDDPLFYRQSRSVLAYNSTSFGNLRHLHRLKFSR